MKKTIMIVGCTIFTMGLAGCGFNNNSAYDNNDGQNRVQTLDVRRDTEQQRLKVANRAERMIERMAEVDNAHVIVSGNDAYVAVRLADKDRAGIYGDRNGNVDMNDTWDGNGRTFTENGRVNQNGNNGIIDGKGDAGDRNGTYGVYNTRDNTLSNKLERDITAKVHQANKGIDNVYVSVDNNLFDTMGTFADDIRNDRNRDGIFNDFTNAMNRFFTR